MSTLPTSIPDHILGMINRSERIDVDFKRQIGDDLWKDIMAFANRYGGHILAGVDQKTYEDGSQAGELVGFESRSIDKDKQRIDGWARSLRPCAHVVTNREYRLDNGLWLLDVHVAEQAEKPVSNGSGVYKIRCHTGTEAMDPSAMRSVVFDRERHYRSLLKSLERNIAHAEGVLAGFGHSEHRIPITVFEKASVLAVLNNPDIYPTLDIEDATAAYQAYEIVDRLVQTKIIWRPIGGESDDVDKLILHHSTDARERSIRLKNGVQQLLRTRDSCLRV